MQKRFAIAWEAVLSRAGALDRGMVLSTYAGAKGNLYRVAEPRREVADLFSALECKETVISILAEADFLDPYFAQVLHARFQPILIKDQSGFENVIRLQSVQEAKDFLKSWPVGTAEFLEVEKKLVEQGLLSS